MSKLYLFLSMVVFLLTANMAVADTDIIYKWKDSSGQIKYTQSKPRSGIPYTVIRDRSSKDVAAKELYAKAPEAASSDDVSAKQDEIIAKQNSEKSRVDALNEQRFAKNCTIAKNNLEALEKTNKIKVDDNGKERYLNADEIAQRKEVAQSNVQKYCK